MERAISEGTRDPSSCMSPVPDTSRMCSSLDLGTRKLLLLIWCWAQGAAHALCMIRNQKGSLGLYLGGEGRCDSQSLDILGWSFQKKKIMKCYFLDSQVA